jgi:hypothetical protein
MRRSKKKEHKQLKKEFMPPMTTLPGELKLVDWNRELLPEFLWIESLVRMYGKLQANHYYTMLLDALDEYEQLDDSEILTGTVSSFNNFSLKTKRAFVNEHTYEIRKCVDIPFGEFLQLYPKSPMRWLTKYIEPKEIYHQSRSEIVTEVSKSVTKLYGAKDEYTGFIRALPLNRYFKHNKISIPPIEDLVSALTIYPQGTREQQYRVESFARNFINMNVMMKESESNIPYPWSRYFWDKNSKLARCKDEWPEYTLEVI